MSLLKPASESSARCFFGLYGPQGAGKSRTATEIAIATRAALNLPGPILAVDTERAYKFQAPRVLEATGQELLLLETREVKTLIEGLKEAKGANVSVCIVDSVTHFLRELRDEWMKKNKRTSMDVGDYQESDKPFKKLLDGMVRSTSNLIICGRQGSVYGLKQNTRGKWTNGPVDTKMAAGEAGYEVDLLLELKQKIVPGKTVDDAKIVRQAFVEKDRSDTIRGTALTVPWDAAEVMAPFFAFLNAGKPAPAAEGGE